MFRRPLLILVIVCSAALAYARGNLKELSVPLKYTPQEGVQSSSPNLLPAVQSTSVAIEIQDARKIEDPLQIGQGTGGDDKVFPMRADRNVAAFVQESLIATAKEWGLTQATPATRNLLLKITRLYLDESNKAVGSVYGAEVKLAYTLKDSKGGVLIEGITAGTAHRYGRAHSVENCNEVLSDALKEAFANVVGEQPVQNAWATGTRATNVGSSSGQSVEERLQALEDLLKKGLITKAEYDQKRTEILKSM